MFRQRRRHAGVYGREEASGDYGYQGGIKRIRIKDKG